MNRLVTKIYFILLLVTIINKSYCQPSILWGTGSLACHGLFVDAYGQKNDAFYPHEMIVLGGVNSGEAIGSNRTNNAPFTNWVGLDFYTNYQRRMCLTNDGNLVIGAPYSIYKLHVEGQMHTRDIYPAGTPNVLIGDDTYFTDIDIQHILGLYSSSNAAVGGLQLGNNGGSLLFGNNGNIGIGTTSPCYAKLQFPNQLGNKISLWGDSNTDNYGLGINASNINVFLPTPNVLNGGRFSVRTGDYNGAEKFVVMNTGNTGIGETNPIFKLQVVQDANSQVAFFGRTENGIGSAIEIYAYPTNSTTPYLEKTAMLYTHTNYGGYDTRNLQISADGAGSSIRFTTGGWNDPSYERMRIDSLGNVGIGTISPTQKLHINGNIQIDGTIRRIYAASNASTEFGIALSLTLNTTGLFVKNIAGNHMIALSPNGGGTNTPVLTARGNGRVGIGTINPAYNLQVVGTAGKSGTAMWDNPSDTRLKKDISEYTDGLDVIMKLHPIWYNYNGKADMPTDERFVGTLAQELKEIAPYMVKPWIYTNEKEEEEEYLSVNYSSLLFTTVNAIKEQQATIEKQNERIERLEKLLNNQTNATTEIEVVNDKENTTLFANIPNPFNDKTVIGCIIPNHIEKANIIITDLQGKLIQSYDINGKGKQEVTFSANGLTKGIYLYSLILDGKVTATQKMLLE